MELIITEKPSSAQKIASAIADGAAEEKKSNGVKYYELTAGGKQVVVVSAVGHLYTVTEQEKKGWVYPQYDIKWAASADVDKNAKYTRKYLKVIEKFAKKADELTIATDFDIEGEVIGYTIMKFAAQKEDAARMKYSTVTKEDLQESYANKQDTIAWGQANAGVTRHELDWYYGINLSRALTTAVKKAGRFKLLSSGRVQTPALKILAEKEKEIQAFKPDPYWQLDLHTKELTARHEKDRFWKEEEADAAKKNTTDKAEVAKLETKQKKVPPPYPFDLTSLQTEAYRSFGMKPKETMQHAQDLYSNGYISYPRTSSQKLDPKLGFEKILKALSKQKNYTELSELLLKRGNLKPNNGKKSDPAHPAIYPTGTVPKKMRERSKKVYDIIVRRFMATFGKPATRETATITLDSGGELFLTKGTRTVDDGWTQFYGSHTKFKEEEMPKLDQGQVLSVKEVEKLSKETQPPRRYTPSSVIKELEKRGLGTKATRADIVENLYNRGYVKNDSIEVTEIGLRTIDTLEKYVPDIIDEALTTNIEEDLEKIRQQEKKPEEVLKEAREHLDKVLAEFKKNESAIGDELLKAEKETINHQTLLGMSPKEKEGMLQLKRSRFGIFVGSSNYPECKSTFTVPTGKVEPARKRCPWCNYPLALVTAKRRGKNLVCFNRECSSRTPTEEAMPRVKEIQENDIECEKGGTLILRQGPYGPFIASDKYPKVRYIENVESIGQVDKEKWKEAEDILEEEYDEFVKQRAKERAEQEASD